MPGFYMSTIIIRILNWRIQLCFIDNRGYNDIVFHGSGIIINKQVRMHQNMHSTFLRHLDTTIDIE